VENWFQRGKISCIGKFVKANNTVFRVRLPHMKDKIASDKSGTARHDNIHR
jgi:hypothetical protein